jgi:inorganic pyrophosphatase
MKNEAGLDPKILAIPAWDVRVDWRDIADVPQYVLTEIAHFFDIYKDLEPGKTSEPLGWRDCAEAEAEIFRAQQRHSESLRPDRSR